MKFGDDSDDDSLPVAAFKAAGLFSTIKVNEMKPDKTAVDSLFNLPFLRDLLTISNLKTELPSYLAKAMEISANFDILEWWRHHSDTLPHWSSSV